MRGEWEKAQELIEDTIDALSPVSEIHRQLSALLPALRRLAALGVPPTYLYASDNLLRKIQKGEHLRDEDFRDLEDILTYIVDALAPTHTVRG